jgi:hypothetical protein
MVVCWHGAEISEGTDRLPHQIGADRAALDYGIEHGITHGGWCARAGWPTMDRLRSWQSTP